MKVACLFLMALCASAQTKTEKEMLYRLQSLEQQLENSNKEKAALSNSIAQMSKKVVETGKTMETAQQKATATAKSAAEQVGTVIDTTVAATAATAAVAAAATKDAQETNDRGLYAILIVQVSGLLLAVIGMMFNAWQKSSDHKWSLEQKRADEEIQSRHRSEMRQAISRVAEKQEVISTQLEARDGLAKAAEAELERIRLARTRAPVNAE